MEAKRLLTPVQVSKWLGLSTGALAQKRYLGNGPQFVKLGGKSVRYVEADVAAWLDAQTRQQTGQVSA